MDKVIIIAEAGVNHNGELGMAKELVDAAAKAGADYVKFQTFIPENLAIKSAKKAGYQMKTTGSGQSQLDMLRQLSLECGSYKQLSEYCKDKGIGFLSTPFDLESVDILKDLGMDYWKMPSGAVTDYPYLVKIAQMGKPVILSTGMSDMKEVSEAVGLLKSEGAGDIILMHCNTEYPTPYEDVNLRAIQTMKKEFSLSVGYSDHTLGFEIPVAAVAMGACMIEKHFTLDRNMEGPDHKASLEPGELAAMVSGIRHIEAAMGDGVKRVSPSERGNIPIVRKSIIAKRKILQGEPFTEDNLTTKRPGTGISPMMWPQVIGKIAARDFEMDEIIEIEQANK